MLIGLRVSIGICFGVYGLIIGLKGLRVAMGITHVQILATTLRSCRVCHVRRYFASQRQELAMDWSIGV